jgi:acyl-CoA thioesterase I
MLRTSDDIAAVSLPAGRAVGAAARVAAVLRRLLLPCVLGLLAACGNSVPPLPALAPGDVIVAFGDSLTYGTGASGEQSYPAVLSQLIGREVIGQGVPGERTDGGLQRLPEVLDEYRPRLLLLCLGGNDMLRKVGASVTEANLRRMVELARSRGTEVVLIAVPAPSLFGGSADFYSRIAEDFSLPIENDIINAVLRDNALKSDPIHPNAEGYRRIAEAIAELLRNAGAV